MERLAALLKFLMPICQMRATRWSKTKTTTTTINTRMMKTSHRPLLRKINPRLVMHRVLTRLVGTSNEESGYEKVRSQA